MALNLDKFKELPFIQKRKKLCYYLHRSLLENTQIYHDDIRAMVDFINQDEYRQLTFEPTQEGFKKFYAIIHQEILHNDPYQEDIIFDEPRQDRVLLPQKIGIILENLRSPFNIGAFFRMGEAFGIHEIIILGTHHSDDKHKKVQKTAKGELIPFKVFNTLDDFLDQEQEAPVLLAIEKAKGSLPLSTLSLQPKINYYFIFGNEEFGVSSSTLQKCQNIYHIPMFGTKNSLNVSVAGGITLHQLTNILL